MMNAIFQMVCLLYMKYVHLQGSIRRLIELTSHDLYIENALLMLLLIMKKDVMNCSVLNSKALVASHKSIVVMIHVPVFMHFTKKFDVLKPVVFPPQELTSFYFKLTITLYILFKSCVLIAKKRFKTRHACILLRIDLRLIHNNYSVM